MTAISHMLLIDDGPAAPELLAAIQHIEVEDHADMADMLRLRIGIGPKEGCAEHAVLDENYFDRLTKVSLLLTIGSGPTEVLIESYVIETNASFTSQPGQSVLNVVAMDPTVLMNLEEKVKPWPNMADSAIASQIFKDYRFQPVIEDTKITRQENDVTTIQRGTDIQFLRGLAERNGFEVFVEVNPLTGVGEGHFHPPRLQERPQGALTVNMGEATNINRFTPRYDMLRPTTAQTRGVDIESQSDQRAETQSQSEQPLGGGATLGGDRPRRVLLSQTGLNKTGELQKLSQAVADRSAWAITAEGELNTVAYGGILRAKRTVNVRGAGNQFSGTYYVERVQHTFAGDSYTQAFTLRRNALGLTGQEVFVEDNALSA